MVEVVALADPSARDPAVVGAKAAGLAAAAAAGLPVLPGWVLPLAASADAIAAGRDRLAGAGRHAAYLAAVEHVHAVAAWRRSSGSVVVRSSTPLDDDGRWAGAFASYLDVESGDVSTAVGGCWASVFAPGALERARETGIDPGSVRVAVLVQPFLRFDAGGTARVRPDGAVAVVAGTGSPAGIVEGRSRGAETVVPADGVVADRTAAAVAALARRAAGALGARSIEWGTLGGELSLLQVGPSTVQATTATTPLPATTHVPPAAARLANLAARFPGPLGDELVLPWALGAAELPDDVPPVSLPDPRTALAEARVLADELAAAAWGASSRVARARAAAVSKLLREGRVEDGLRRIGDPAPPDVDTAGRLLASIGGVGELLVERGLLPAADLVWGLTDRELDRALEGDRPILRLGPTRWEPFVALVVRALGDARTGTAVSPGLAAGPFHRIAGLRALGRPRPRAVVVAPLPLPQLAPLLWHCAGLVTTGGSSGAHLFEVARSLGVPAVAAVGPIDDPDDGLVAVDGDAGTVTSLAARVSAAPIGARPAAMV
ncbi:MAG TPA: PEP/pyruvate-binding domain-containing protein [Actinomycetota bacterium]|nr:PEP/pyruvate-binding domain-containing protein [Actinomycetota bacterium]